jgi:hypothetical protein
MKKVEHDLLSEKYTKVWHEDPEDIVFNAPHHFVVTTAEEQTVALNMDGLSFTPTELARVDFQTGPIKENGVNGVCNEDLIAMVICRLEHFQKSEYSSRDNAIAITHLEDALLRLRKRTMGREKRGVEGTSTI